MVIDTSAVIALLLQEPEARRISQCLENDPLRYISAVGWFETHMVMAGRFGTQGRLETEALFRELRVEIVALDVQHVHTALAAWQKYGKGRHPAALNLGDCCAYATAVLLNQPLLYKGDDFARSDVPRVEY